MIKIASASAFALAGLALATVSPASAEPYRYGDRNEIRQDIRDIRQDRESIRIDEARVARERADVEAARGRERDALRRGDVSGVARAYEQEQREQRELTAAQRKLQADHGKLHQDTRELRHDLNKHRRWWHWG